MNFTNIHGLPDSLAQAIKNDPYSAGASDISVTKLIDSPKRRALMKRYGEFIVTDLSKSLFSLLGQGVHNVLERSSQGEEIIAEQRFFSEVEGWTISGQVDRFNTATGELEDYKVTSAYKVIKGDVKEWERQLNVLAWLLRQAGHNVEKLSIVAIIRDWSMTDAKNKPDYPKAPFAVINISLWKEDSVFEYIQQRIRLHQAAERGEPIGCSDEERWYEGTTWALMKKGGKRAIKVYRRKEDIGTEIADGLYVEERKGGYRRCAEYCEVSAFCDQYQSERQDAEASLWEAADGRGG